MGCTHFPVLRDVIARSCGPGASTRGQCRHDGNSSSTAPRANRPCASNPIHQGAALSVHGRAGAFRAGRTDFPGPGYRTGIGRIGRFVISTPPAPASALPAAQPDHRRYDLLPPESRADMFGRKFALTHHFQCADHRTHLVMQKGPRTHRAADFAVLFAARQKHPAFSPGISPDIRPRGMS